MSFVERRVEPRPSSGEAPFAINEVFFSRTNDRGIIQAGNYIFKRVSFYSWDELIGAPHRTIRHPDMPRGLFHLFWDTIKAGRSVAGQPPLLSAIADGTFGLMKRPADKGRGLDGVARKAPDHYNPATDILEGDQA